MARDGKRERGRKREVGVMSEKGVERKRNRGKEKEGSGGDEREGGRGKGE